jgi:hypothetical protein
VTGKLYLAPATRSGGVFRYLQITVLSGIQSDLYSNDLDSNRNQIIRVWGLTSSIKGSWDTIEKGDWLLFYTRENEYEYAARVIGKERNPELGNTIRNQVLDADKTENRDWNLLVFLDEPVSVSVSGVEVAELFDYGNQYPVRFIRVTDKRLEALKGGYGDVEGFISVIEQ